MKIKENNHKRRGFLAKLSAWALGAAALPAFTAPPKQKKLQSHFVHHVYFWMNEPDNPMQRQKLLDGMNSLLQIETIRFSQIGEPADTDRPVIDHSYSFSFLVVFDDKAGHDAYQVHPIHKKFVDECSNLWGKIIVYDSVKPMGT